MGRMLWPVIAGVFFAFSVAAPVMAISGANTSTYNAGVAAYNKGDYDAALQIFRKLAEQGNAEAQNNLGVMNEKGYGTPQSYADAAKFYQLAAGQGAAPAQFNLALLYAKGQGVQKNYVLAHMWFNLAAVQGNKSAKKDLVKVARLMTIAQIVRAQKLARNWMANKKAIARPATFRSRWYYPY